MSGWVTIWDVAAEPFRWGNAGEGLGALSVVALGAAVFGALRGRSRGGAVAAVCSSLAVALAMVWGSLDHLRVHRMCADASRHEEGRVLEGVVHDYHPLTSYWQRPTDETFTVGGERSNLRDLPVGRTVRNVGPASFMPGPAAPDSIETVVGCAGAVVSFRPPFGF